MAATTTAPAGKSGRLRDLAAETWAPIAAIGRSRNLRRIGLALAGSTMGDWAYATAVTVWAYGVGGAKAVGIWTAVRLISMALTAPFSASLSDRLPRKQVMIAADLLRAALVAGAAVCLLAGTPAAPIFVLATLVSVVSCAFRPAQASLLPSLVDQPEELTAANGASSLIESLAFFAGPALGALLLTFATMETVFFLNVATFLLSALLVAGVRPRDRQPTQEAADDEDAPRSGATAGFGTIARSKGLRLITLLVCLQTVVAGAFPVFGVLLAVELLDTGPKGVGYLDAVFGIGAVLGGMIAMARSTRHRLASDLAIGTLLWSLPLLLVAWQHYAAAAFVAVALLGLGNPLVDVSLYTIVQRISPDAVLARVLGAQESLLIGAMALGAAATPFLVDLVGLQGTLVILALVVGVPTLLLVPACRALDTTLRPPDGLALLRSTSIFAPLGPARLESLAQRLQKVVLPPSYVVLRQGDPADRFFLIESGTVEVTEDGGVVRQQGPGDFFGEIALLLDVPRTATVTTTEETVLYTLSRTAFLEALSGSDDSYRAADEAMRYRLGV